ncbi:MAG: DUF192 domain-containing protein [Elusimicrobiota bacterium]|jgi:uncharacterized membrane protein (UPF0127 family)|nr:DUF192 domain-containing protein [Elusimicrobiota bacterium]
MKSQIKVDDFYNIDVFCKMKIKTANSFFDKFFGFMFKKNADYAILFINCFSVHTFFMRFDIDVIFLDKKGNIVYIKKNVRPWRIVPPVRNAAHILEIPANLLKLRSNP